MCDYSYRVSLDLLLSELIDSYKFNAHIVSNTWFIGRHDISNPQLEIIMRQELRDFG